MKSFKHFVNEAAEKNVSAAEYENYITLAFNGGPKKDKVTQIKSPESYKKSIPVLSVIVKSLKDAGFKGKMTQTGKAKGAVNSTWLGKDSTPKADMVVGKNGISLKKRGGSQLMSSKKAETLSTFNAAVEFMDQNAPENANKLANSIASLMEEFVVPKNIGTIGQLTAKAKGKDKISGKDEKKLVGDYLAKGNVFKSMTEEVKTFFDTNEDFKNYFIYEAATGANKFKGDKLPAAANYIVAFDASTGDTSIHRISKGYGVMGEYISTLASSTKLRFSWKTHSSKSQKTFPSFRVDVKEDVGEDETFESMFNEEFSELDEGIMSSIADRITGFVKKAINKISDLAKKGLAAILRFFGFSPDKIQISKSVIR